MPPSDLTLVPPGSPEHGDGTPEGERRPRAPTSRRGHLWVIEDSPLEAKRALELLSGSYEVEVYADAAVALEQLAQGAPLPRLVVLDWLMPHGFSGLETCRFLRERYDEVTLPILVVTASRQRDTLQEAFAAGANDFVPRPYNDAELLARVRTLMRVGAQAEALREREEALRARDAQAQRAHDETQAARGQAEGARGEVQAVTQALRTSEERHRTLFEAIDDGYCLVEVLTDGAGRAVDIRYLETNAAFTKHSGLEDVVGRTAREAVAGLDPARLERYGRVAATGVSERFETYVSGLGRWFDVFATRVGAPSRREVALVFTDVTARKRVEAEREALLVSEQAARAEAEARADFEQKLIGIVGHDLRQPLQAITMSASVLLRRPGLDERARTSAHRVATAAERMQRMLRDILDFTRARLGGGIPLGRAPADVAQVAREAAEEAELAHPGRHVALRLEGSGQGAWDADRLRQVLDNLLANALAYSPADGPVQLEVDGREAEAVRVRVHNAGTPIPEHLLPVLFEPMTRGGDVGAHERSVGLGLYIVRHLVEAHGGRVEVASSAQEGTTFTVHLPRGAAAAGLP